MIIYTKDNLIKELQSIADRGWIDNARHGNHGGIGNTLEDLLGITENNLPIPNAAEWELKSQRINTSSLTTLFHIEPSPRAVKFVPQILLLNYGWKHQEAGKKYTENEMSFRQTIHGLSPSDRGFQVIIDRINSKVLISFDSSKVVEKHSEWLIQVQKKIGLGQLEPQPYWGFDDLSNKAGTKLLNCFYVQAEVKKDGDKEFYKYSKVTMLQKFNFDGFLAQIEKGNILVDFDARTGHNHGTKFRMRQNCLPELYQKATIIV
ncbi:MvaI/BcnI family restriction endonuclease [Aquirufa salirivi]|uniref:MvaI/BcnI family restriction endonuclease n=1 Tax=Aquirufa salirivi TaxID=3104729 RepID=A0ABW8RV65_9BACT